MSKPKWIVQVKGKRCSECWEIYVIREDNKHGQLSYGWFNNTKLLISHNGGPCHWPICGFVWDQHLATAHSLCEVLNNGGKLEWTHST